MWRIFVGSNCGFDRESVAWRVREMARERVDPRYYHYAPEGVVAGWIRPVEVETQRRSLPPPVFDRLWGNKWNECAESEFVPITAFDACRAAVPPLTETDRLVVGVDAGVTSDNF